MATNPTACLFLRTRETSPPIPQQWSASGFLAFWIRQDHANLVGVDPALREWASLVFGASVRIGRIPRQEPRSGAPSTCRKSGARIAQAGGRQPGFGGYLPEGPLTDCCACFVVPNSLPQDGRLLWQYNSVATNSAPLSPLPQEALLWACLPRFSSLRLQASGLTSACHWHLMD